MPLERLGNLLLQGLLFLSAVNRLLNLFSDVAFLVASGGGLTLAGISLGHAIGASVALVGVPLDRLSNLLLQRLLFLAAIDRLLYLFTDVALFGITGGSLALLWLGIALNLGLSLGLGLLGLLLLTLPRGAPVVHSPADGLSDTLRKGLILLLGAAANMLNGDWGNSTAIAGVATELSFAFTFALRVRLSISIGLGEAPAAELVISQE